MCPHGDNDDHRTRLHQIPWTSRNVFTCVLLSSTSNQYFIHVYLVRTVSSSSSPMVDWCRTGQVPPRGRTQLPLFFRVLRRRCGHVSTAPVQFAHEPCPLQDLSLIFSPRRPPQVPSTMCPSAFRVIEDRLFSSAHSTKHAFRLCRSHTLRNFQRASSGRQFYRRNSTKIQLGLGQLL